MTISPKTVRAGHSFIRELRDAVLAPADHPLLIRRYEEYGHRRKPYRPYLIPYMTETDTVIIDAILYSAQDYETMLFPEP